MRFCLGLCVLLLSGVGSIESTHAADWAESSEVRARLDQLKAHPIKATPTYYVDELPDHAMTSNQRTAKPWRSVSYDAIAPIEPPKKTGHGRSIHVEEADKLGYQLNNAEMRNKVLELYRRPDVVVEQYVIGQ